MSTGPEASRPPAITAEAWDRRHAPRDPTATCDEPNRFVRELTADLLPGRALDLGIGGGRNAIWLALRGWRVTGVDFSRGALDHVARHAARTGVSIELVHADVEDYLPSAASFELVIAVHLHPLPPVRAVALRRACDALTDGGWLLVVGRDRADFGKGPPGPPDIAQRYSATQLRNELQGIELIRCASVARHDLPLGVEQQAQIDTVAWGRRPRAQHEQHVGDGANGPRRLKHVEC